MNWIRTEMTIKNTKMEAIERQLFNFEKQLKSNDQIIKYGVIENTAERMIAWTLSNLGLFMSYRMGIYDISKQKQPDGSLLLITKTIDHPDVPAPEDGTIMM